MQKKILHLLTDDKFTDYVIKQFIPSEMCSELVLIPSNNALDLVKLISQCTIIQHNTPEFDALVMRIGQYAGIVLHGMFWGGWQIPILENVPKHVKIAWVFWGGELYARHDVRSTFLTPVSFFLYKLHQYKKKCNADYKQDCSWEVPLDLYKRVDYCVTSLDEEYDFARQYTQSSFRHIWYSYYSIEETIGSLIHCRCNGNNVWVGNSAILANNHLDVLWKLWRCGLLRRLMKQQKVIMPLSYGDPWVRNMIKRVGRCVLGHRMQVLENYLQRDDYNATMLSCSTMILGYLEPAANGNIMTALWLGMRVYLSEKSMAYTYYKRIGCLVFSIEHDLNPRNKDCLTILTEDEILHNRKVLLQHYGKQHTERAVVDLVTTLIQ